MPLRLSLADVKRLGKTARATIAAAPGKIAFSIDTWREIPQRITVRLGPEDTAHLEIMNWLRTNLGAGWFAFHIPSEANRTRVIWALLRILGFFAGLPDICIVARGGRVYFVEVKRADEKPRLSPAQRSFQAWCEAYQIPYLVAQSAGEVEAWLAGLSTVSTE